MDNAKRQPYRLAQYLTDLWTSDQTLAWVDHTSLPGVKQANDTYLVSAAMFAYRASYVLKYDAVSGLWIVGRCRLAANENCKHTYAIVPKRVALRIGELLEEDYGEGQRFLDLLRDIAEKQRATKYSRDLGDAVSFAKQSKKDNIMEAMAAKITKSMEDRLTDKTSGVQRIV